MQPQPEAPALDLDHLAEQTFGDAELERDLLALFEMQCTRIAPVLRAPGEAARRAEAAHALRGSAAAVGARALAAICAAFEEEGLKGRDPAARDLKRLDGAVAAVRIAIAARLAALGAEGLAKADGLA